MKRKNREVRSKMSASLKRLPAAKALSSAQFRLRVVKPKKGKGSYSRKKKDW